MKNVLALSTLLAIWHQCQAQTQLTVGPGGQIYSYQGPCCDASGDPSNPADPAYQTYSVKSFKQKTPVEIAITSIIIGKERHIVDFKFRAAVGAETEVLNVTDSVGIKLVLGQMRENKRNKYIYKLIVYRRDGASNCWRPLSTFNQMFDVYAQTISLSLFSLGDRESEGFVEIVEGWMKLN